jgi:hypothetical protein
VSDDPESMWIEEVTRYVRDTIDSAVEQVTEALSESVKELR